MFHYFQSITNQKGDALVGYYIGLADTVTEAAIPIYSDESSTPIASVSGLANKAKTDSDGMVSLYVTAGTYHLDIYAPDGVAFRKRIRNVPMTRGEPGPPGPTGTAAITGVATLTTLPDPASNLNEVVVISDAVNGAGKLGVAAYSDGTSWRSLADNEVVTFDPLTLYGAGEKGFIFDPSNAATVFSDTAATTQAAGGGTIAALRDRSPGALLATQPTAGSRPSLQVDAGGRRFIRSDGIKFLTASGLNLTGSTAFTATVAVFTSTYNDGFVFTHAAAAPFAGGFGLHGGHEAEGRPSGSMGDDVAGGHRFISAPFYRKRKGRVITVEFDPSGATDADRVKMWVDGQPVTTSTWLTSGTPGAGVFGNRLLGLFGQADGGVTGAYDFFFLAGVNRKLSIAERAKLEGYARAKFAPVPTYSVRTFRRSRPATITANHAAASPYATIDYDTTATSVAVSYQMPIQATAAGFALIGVWVDGAYYSQTLSTSEAGTMTLALPAGSKRVSLVTPAAQYQGVGGAQPFYTIRGGSITEVAFNAPATRVEDATTAGLVLYGDSITMGQGADFFMRDGWAMQVRAAYPAQNVTIEGAGALGLYHDATGVGELDALADKLASTNPAKIYLAIGTNDYGVNLWTAANFQTAYGQLLDKLNARLPAAQVLCMTPLKRTTETANGLGSTLAQYRTAIATAAAGRSYCTVIDGSGIILVGDLVDDVHPNQAGHNKVAVAAKAALGI